MRKPHPLPYSGGGGALLFFYYLLFNASKK